MSYPQKCDITNNSKCQLTGTCCNTFDTQSDSLALIIWFIFNLWICNETMYGSVSEKHEPYTNNTISGVSQWKRKYSILSPGKYTIHKIENLLNFLKLCMTVEKNSLFRTDNWTRIQYNFLISTCFYLLIMVVTQ